MAGIIRLDYPTLKDPYTREKAYPRQRIEIVVPEWDPSETHAVVLYASESGNQFFMFEKNLRDLHKSDEGFAEHVGDVVDAAKTFVGRLARGQKL